MTPSKRLRKRLDTLRKRCDFLYDRVQLQLRISTVYPAYDVAELSSIEFAIRFIENNRELALRQIAEEKNELPQSRTIRQAPSSHAAS